jgi:ADP-ribose pyrophosphatase YjhB (NUDIX family)
MKVRPAAVIQQNNQLLTLRYKYGEQYVHMLPGGNVDPGELLPDTIQRELWEELGIKVTVHEFIGMGEVVSWFEKEDVLHCLFTASISEGEPIINAKECSAEQLVWLKLEDINNNIFYPNIPSLLLKYLTNPTAIGYFGKINQPEIK